MDHKHWPIAFSLWLYGTGISLGMFISFVMIYPVTKERRDLAMMLVSGVVAFGFVMRGFWP